MVFQTSKVELKNLKQSFEIFLSKSNLNTILFNSLCMLSNMSNISTTTIWTTFLEAEGLKCKEAKN